MSDVDGLVEWLTGVLDKLADLATESMVSWDRVAGWDGPACHVEAHSPRAVLARVEAERAIVAGLVRTMNARPADPGDYVNSDWVESNAQEAEDALRLLAYGHRFDAPGYRDEWVPAGVSP